MSYGAEDMGWVEPEEMGRGTGDSMMQDAILRALTEQDAALRLVAVYTVERDQAQAERDEAVRLLREIYADPRTRLPLDLVVRIGDLFRLGGEAT